MISASAAHRQSQYSPCDKDSAPSADTAKANEQDVLESEATVQSRVHVSPDVSNHLKVPSPRGGSPSQNRLTLVPKAPDFPAHLAQPFLRPEGLVELIDHLDSCSAAELDDAVAKYFQAALEMNLGKKTGNLRRVVFLLSSNPQKTAELDKNGFGLYGIEVLRAPVSEDPKYIEALLRVSKQSNIKVMAVMREQNYLCNDLGARLDLSDSSSFVPGARVTNFSDLTIFKLERDGKIKRQMLSASTTGHLKRAPFKPDPLAFGWDERFVADGVDLTFHELRQMGYKISPRDQNVSQYITQEVHYGKPKGLNHLPLNQEKVVDFAVSVADWVDAVKEYNLPLVQQYGVRRMLNSVVGQGIFFRSPINRREVNYWSPGLNAGLPYTAKDDRFHELTYILHDFGHFAVPDLLFDGHVDEKSKLVYIMYRMMSEAMTMVIADMLFVDAVKKSALPEYDTYDFNKRRIYPLFLATGLRFSDDPTERMQTLLTLMRANVAYCLRGDDSLYRDLIQQNGGSAEAFAALEAFKSKFMPFFVEDFRWTNRNFSSMAERHEEIQNWWSHLGNIEQLRHLQAQGVSAFMRKLDPSSGDLLTQVQEAILAHLIVPAIAPSATAVADGPAPKSEQLRNTFLRYIAGQMAIYSHFEKVDPQANLYRQRLIEVLQREIRADGPISVENVENVRSEFTDYLKHLQRLSLITEDDFATYKDIYPIFPPFYVSYDREATAFKPLSEVSSDILGDYRSI